MTRVVGTGVTDDSLLGKVVVLCGLWIDRQCGLGCVISIYTGKSHDEDHSDGDGMSGK